MKYVEWKGMIMSRATGANIHNAIGVLGVVYSCINEPYKESEKLIIAAVERLNEILHGNFSANDIDEFGDLNENKLEEREREILDIVNTQLNPLRREGIAIRKDSLTLKCVGQMVIRGLIELVLNREDQSFILVRAR
jgi:hypothetical protein